MANQAFTGPEGRLVQGDAFDPRTKDKMGAPLTVKTGPNMGQPTKNWVIAVAYPKNDPATLPYLQKLAEIARAAWPAHFAKFDPNTPPTFGSTHPNMSLKIQDGDGFDGDGKPNSGKPGFAGCWVVKYSTSIQAPEVFHAGKYDPMERVTDARELPRGYYVRVFASAQSNANDQRPGIYVNLSKIEIRRPGEIIVSGPSAEDAFGGSGTQTRAPTPPAPPTPATPGGDILVATGKDGYTIATLQAAGWTDQQMIDGGYATKPAAPPAPPTPPAPPAPPKPPAPPAPPHSAFMNVDPNGPPDGFKMLAAAGGATYKSMTDAGWTHELLVQHGMVGPLA